MHAKCILEHFLKKLRRNMTTTCKKFFFTTIKLNIQTAQNKKGHKI